jgi:hypothetical protein
MSRELNTISVKYVSDYILENYGELRHDVSKMVKAIRSTSKEFSLNKKDLFHYIIEHRDTIPMTTSYGFDTRYGRAIRSTFEDNYLQLKYS